MIESMMTEHSISTDGLGNYRCTCGWRYTHVGTDMRLSPTIDAHLDEKR